MSAITTSRGLDDQVRKAQQGEYVRVSNLDWQSYRKFMDALAGQRVRFTYDRGSLEIMPISTLHAMYSRLLCLFVAILTEECNLPLRFGGDMTFERADLDRGHSADECFWIEHADKVRGKRQIDFAHDPPPDLVVEVEISRTVLSRLPIYAAIRVPEVWRTDGESLQVGRLQANSQYQWTDRSPTFASIPIAETVRFLKMAHTQDHGDVLREFRTWVREQLTKSNVAKD
jgi:Uma2 family endonuclease